jgi:hypothetical protein
MKLLNGSFPVLFIAVLFYRLDKTLAKDKGFEGGAYGGQYGEGSKETDDNKSRKIPSGESYMGSSRQRENSGGTRDDYSFEKRKDSSRKNSFGGPYGGIYDKNNDGRNEDKVDKGDAHKGSYGTYGTYGGPVPTADLTLRSYPTLEPTQQPSSYPSANEFDASESTFLGGNSISKEHAPPDYISPYAQYVPPNNEMPHVPKEDVPSYNQKIPHYVPQYTPPSDTPSAKYTSNTCYQCCPPPPPPPPPCCQCCPPPPYFGCSRPIYVVDSFSRAGFDSASCCGPRRFSYQTSGSNQQPNQGYDTHY